MASIFERVQSKGIAALSYLIGDDESGTAAVIDPRPDVDIYIKLAQRHNVSITHVMETHIHADFVSGARELAARCDAASIVASVEGGADYGFELQQARAGDRFEFGETILTVRHTPGHTPEHISYEASTKGCEVPWGAFTGDSLFVASAGRPDLLGKDADQLASKLYDTFFSYFGSLPDGTLVHPSHGHGSPCGADIGDRLVSTIGYEKQFNPYFQITSRSQFVEHALATAPPEPAYYKRMKKLNAAGPEVLGSLPAVPALSAKKFKSALEEGQSLLIDTRHALAFGGGHIPGALNLGATPMLTVWAGWLLDPDQPMLLVLDDECALERITAWFVRSGYTNFTGYLAGGMSAWDKAGGHLAAIPQMTVHELGRRGNDLQILDVRAPSEWDAGHIPKAKHLFLGDLPNKSSQLDKAEPTITYCASGYRASIAASILKKQGFTDVRTVPGSWAAWQAAGLPVSGNGRKP